ncbi:glutamate synthase (NADPH/NADH) small chain [Ferrithrix thermotolerans DSM 19514]|uniref:Glutamate synthase (NADPH/NADH) small chain n=1 Tax=Ferrithrix thermotolerans DSM 19514 TaxID=1121881 RepID=A0A1M4V0Z8_9ACTN|nr:glutamate synthase subunit beta [Ferrithrix thermotolerans]SHE62671.1 glutamate synthase (NADPH/NADH) small chain [Ferrithrix thermotolerans DSM 19514]
MADPRGFLKFTRGQAQRRPVELRLKDWREVYNPIASDFVTQQASRCMDCGIPFCHQGCPLGNLIPEWNDLVYREEFDRAIDRLHATNNFPEFTGRLCPAPCETACVLGINSDPVSIELVEKSIAEHAFEHGLIQPIDPVAETGRRVAVVGSGPSGLAAAQQLRRAGHSVDVYERSDKPGGLLRYGIPEFKMEKWVLERRLTQLRAEGITFICNTEIGIDMTLSELRGRYDAVVLCIGAGVPREIEVEGRELSGIYQAMEFLPLANRVALKELPFHPMSAKDKAVVIVGGGDTGADCLGTVHRQGARSVVQLEIMPEPPRERPASNPWPTWPTLYRISSAHEEGGDRMFSLSTKRFIGSDGKVQALEVVEVEMKMTDSGLRFEEIPGSQRRIEADLVLIATGFLGPEKTVQNGSPLPTDPRSNIQTDRDWMVEEGLFAAGDCRRGQSLIVWAIAEGRSVAKAVDRYLMGESFLPAPIQTDTRALAL